MKKVFGNPVLAGFTYNVICWDADGRRDLGFLNSIREKAFGCSESPFVWEQEPSPELLSQEWGFCVEFVKLPVYRRYVV
jgi:hypothetical protein